MSDVERVARQFMDAMKSNDADQYARVLRPDAGIRVYRWNESAVYRPSKLVIDYLQQEWSTWDDPMLEVFTIIANEQRAAIEFRIQATEHGRYMEHERSIFLTFAGDQIQTIDLYCSEPFPSAHRQGWIAPATLNDEQVLHLFEEWQFSFDIREWIPPRIAYRGSLRGGVGGSGDPHPGSNSAWNMRWTAEEADIRIEELIEEHRRRNIGFHLLVAPFDTPSDLRERLEQHGFVLAGDQSLMARVGLEHLEIPTNPSIEIEILDGANPQAVDDTLAITARTFNWTPEQVEERRPGWHERVKNPEFRKKEIQYLARLNRVPIANARLLFQVGIAYLGGASTLPEYRGQHVYSTLLRRRLEDAHARGYHVAAIHAEPMSRRVVSKYGFKEYGKAYLYVWMPVIDMAVVKSLVPDE